MRSTPHSHPDLHRPTYEPPWEAETVTTGLANGVLRDVWMIGRVNDEQGFIAELPGFLSKEAAAIADLWGWIERADRYETVLRKIASDVIPGTQVREAATVVLREEGRLLADEIDATRLWEEDR